MRLHPYPESITRLLTDKAKDSKHFRKRIPYYNNVFVSFNMRQDNLNVAVSAILVVGDVSARSTRTAD
jgi:hypothetical protein